MRGSSLRRHILSNIAQRISVMHNAAYCIMNISNQIEISLQNLITFCKLKHSWWFANSACILMQECCGSTDQIIICLPPLMPRKSPKQQMCAQFYYETLCFLLLFISLLVRSFHSICPVSLLFLKYLIPIIFQIPAKKRKYKGN